MKFLFTGLIKPDGKFYFSQGQRELYEKYIVSLRKSEDVFAALSVEVVKKHRTINQNNLYWLRCTYLANHLGMRKESLHEEIMSRCNFGKWVFVAGKKVFDRLSSGSLSTVEFSELMKMQDAIVEFENEDKATELWLVLPTKENV